MKRNDCDDFSDTVIIGRSALHPLAKSAIQMLILLLLLLPWYQTIILWARQFQVHKGVVTTPLVNHVTNKGLVGRGLKHSSNVKRPSRDNISSLLIVGILIIIIIIHRLRSRRPQGFSMHDDHQQMRQSAVLALLLHYPQAIFVHN